jgi:hypothetical protein
MTVQTAAFGTYQAIGNREDLLDEIYNVDPFDTPFMSLVGRSRATAKTHEWQTDTLATAVTTNAQIEGDVIVGTAATPTVRLANYCQISYKDVVVTGTQEAVNKAGRASEVAYQAAKKLKELKRDMESVICANQRGLAGATGTARKLRSLAAFINTDANTNRYTGSTSGTKGKDSTAPNSATGAPTDAGNTRAFTELLLKSVLAGVYSSGGDPTFIMVGPHNKQVLSTFTGRSSSREIVPKSTILAAADVYASDYGDLKIFPNRFGRDRDVVVGDPAYAAISFLRPPVMKDLAVTGDSIRKFIVTEYTLEMRNYKAFGVVADVNTSS